MFAFYMSSFLFFLFGILEEGGGGEGGGAQPYETSETGRPQTEKQTVVKRGGEQRSLTKGSET